MLTKLRSCIFTAPDLDAAKAFYTALLGIAPYFDLPDYVGYDVAGYELGLDPNGPPPAGTNPIAYWSVGDLKAVIERAMELGAQIGQAPQEVGGGTIMAHIKDPWGNLVGLIDELSHIQEQ